MRQAKELLERFTERLPIPPPPEGKHQAHHSLTVENGFLMLTLLRDGRWTSFCLYEDDLNLPVTTLVEQISVLLESMDESEKQPQ